MYQNCECAFLSLVGWKMLIRRQGTLIETNIYLKVSQTAERHSWRASQTQLFKLRARQRLLQCCHMDCYSFGCRSNLSAIGEPQGRQRWFESMSAPAVKAETFSVPLALFRNQLVLFQMIPDPTIEGCAAQPAERCCPAECPLKHISNWLYRGLY